MFIDNAKCIICANPVHTAKFDKDDKYDVIYKDLDTEPYVEGGVVCRVSHNSLEDIFDSINNFRIDQNNFAQFFICEKCFFERAKLIEIFHTRRGNTIVQRDSLKYIIENK